MLELTDILQKVVALLGDIKLGGKKSCPALASLDHGILKVAVMVAAIDGEILPGEYAAFDSLLKSCRRCRKNVADATFDRLLEYAGRIMVMAKSRRYTDEARLAAFKELALKAMPEGFRNGSMADLRRAFALWQVMAMSDGSVSDLERAALRLLLMEFAGVSADDARPTMILEEDFLVKVEAAVRGLVDPATRKAAQDELLALVTTIVLPDGGKSRRHQACCVMVATLWGIAVAMSALGGKVP